MEYKFKAGQKVRILDVESLAGRSAWAGRELTLKRPESGGEGWEVPTWSTVEQDCYYRFRESEMEPVAEGPVRTVTRQEIIPGTHDGVVVRVHDESSVYVEYCGAAKTADQLERAAAVLTALAGALRDGE